MEEFDAELAKKIIRVVVGKIIDDDKIDKAISYFRTIYKDIDDADGILYYLKTSKKSDRAAISISDEEYNDIFGLISAYETTLTGDKHNIIKQIIEQHNADTGVAGGARKSSVKRRKSSRRSTKHRKSSRRQSPLRRRRTNKK